MSDILNLDDFIASVKQKITLNKTAARTTIAAQFFSLFELAGNPGAGVLAGTNTTAGVVPTDATAGYPLINPFGASATGRLARVEFASSVACRIALFDRLWLGGPYNFNDAIALSGQPSYASRIPNGDYKDTEIWVEQVTAATGNQAVAVTYTDQDGNAGAATGAWGISAAPTLGRCWQLPLASGDGGVQTIESVTGSVASAGTFNVMVLRPLWSGRVRSANDGDVHDLLKTGLPQLFADSAIYMLVAADSTSSGVPELELTLANK